MDGDNDQCDQANGDDGVHDEHQPVPGRRVRPLGLAFHEDAVFVFLADDLGHGVVLVLSRAPDSLYGDPRNPPEFSRMQKANPGAMDDLEGTTLQKDFPHLTALVVIQNGQIHSKLSYCRRPLGIASLSAASMAASIKRAGPQT